MKPLPTKSGTKKKTKKASVQEPTQEPVLETRGRPSVFCEEVANKIIQLHSEGRTDKQVAEIIGVHENTVIRWRKEKDFFRWSSKEAKMLADEMVEASLFKKATGFNYYEEQATKDGVQALQKYHAPDTKAQIFWLKNRRSDEWKDKIEVEQRSTTSILLDTGEEEEEYSL